MDPKETEEQLKHQIKKVGELKKTLNKVLDFYHMDTKEWVDTHGPGMTTKQLGDEIRSTLSGL